jgi:hypothetical protein
VRHAGWSLQVAEVVAGVKGVSEDAVAAAAYTNTLRVFLPTRFAAEGLS